MRPTKAIINLSGFKNNLQIIKARISPDTKIMGIVKANAYGHGIIEIAKHALKFGVFSLGVAIPEEAVYLRSHGIDCDILVLGGIDPSQVDLILDYDLSVCLFERSMAELINHRAREKNKRVKIHLKYDSGMGRIGIRDKNETIKLCMAINAMDHLDMEGVFTHFACADQCEWDFTFEQLHLFDDLIRELQSLGIVPRWIHAANTAAMAKYPMSHFNMVRIGIGMYGYLPPYTNGNILKLEPILEWHTKVIHLKRLDKGCSVSYGRTYTTQKPTIIATLPVGYGDGYNRLLSNKGWVLIREKKAPIVGNICMDQMMVDVTDIPGVQLDDDVVLIGRQGEESIKAGDLARLYGTIPYEVLTNISPRVPRLYMEE